MKTLLSRFWIGAVCVFAPFLSAEEPNLANVANDSIEDAREEVVQLKTDEELDRLVARIALYPDVLVALILPASTNPTDVVLAARSLKSAPGRTNFDSEPWSDSVKGLVHYREAIEMLDVNIGWTKELGDSFLAQPADVMNALQRVRVKARADGWLKDTPQQTVVVEEEVVRIYPRETTVVYVPRYDYDVLFYGRRYESNDVFLTFGLGFTAGYWLSYDCDWRYRRIWTIPPAYRHAAWDHHRDWHWRRDRFDGHRDNWHAWNPPHRNHPRVDTGRPHRDRFVAGTRPNRDDRGNRGDRPMRDHRPDRTPGDRPRLGNAPRTQTPVTSTAPGNVNPVQQNDLVAAQGAANVRGDRAMREGGIRRQPHVDGVDSPGRVRSDRGNLPRQNLGQPHGQTQAQSTVQVQPQIRPQQSAARVQAQPQVSAPQVPAQSRPQVQLGLNGNARVINPPRVEAQTSQPQVQSSAREGGGMRNHPAARMGGGGGRPDGGRSEGGRRDGR